MTSVNAPRPPRLPRPLVDVLQPLDRHFIGPLVAGFIRRALAAPLAVGLLAELEGRTARLAFLDTPFAMHLGLREGRLQAVAGRNVDVTISTSVVDALRLITRREDPDTLFFQRRLRIEGDVELGLYLKNALDAVDESELPTPLQRALPRLSSAIGRYETVTKRTG